MVMARDVIPGGLLHTALARTVLILSAPFTQKKDCLAEVRGGGEKRARSKIGKVLNDRLTAAAVVLLANATSRKAGALTPDTVCGMIGDQGVELRGQIEVLLPENIPQRHHACECPAFVDNR